MKNIKLKSIIVFVITVFILYILLKDNFSIIMNKITDINILFFSVACLLFIVYFLVDSIALFILTRMYNKSIKLSDIVKIGIETKFFNGITPLASGGQPWQVYRLGKHNINYVNGTSIVSQNYLLFQIAMLIITSVSFVIFHFFDSFSSNNFLYLVTIIGFLINLLVLVFLLIIGFTKKINYKVISFFVKIFAKLRFIKDYDTTLDNWKKRCETYRNNTIWLFNNKKILVFGVILYLISTSIYYFIPFFVFLSLGVNDISITTIYILSALIFIAGCFIPIPGASGGMEYAYLEYFSPFLSNQAVLYSTLIIWRFITFYFPTFVGGLYFCFRKK